MDIEYLIPPLIEEILAQQRMILEMQKFLIELLAKPLMVYKSDKED